MGKSYFWKPETKEVIVHPGGMSTEGAALNGVVGYQCVDTEYPPNSGMRYGVFESSPGVYPNSDWSACHVTQLDPAFRVHLLLLGVS